MSRTVKQRVLAVILFFSILALWLPAALGGQAGPEQYLTKINSKFMITPDQAQEWHRFKDQGGPTYSGNASWQSFMAFLEKKLTEYGVKDLVKNEWTYDRWFTSDFPDDSGWSLASDGQPIKAAGYGAYSGSTGQDGITAPMVIYNPKSPPETYKGKIVVFRTAPHPKPPFDEKYKMWFTLNDFEFRTGEDYPPLFAQVPPQTSVTYDVWWQLHQTVLVNKVLRQSQAAGGVVVFNMSFARLAGLYTFPVMPLYMAPTIYLDRAAGRKVLQDAKQGKNATIKLLAQVEPTKTFQLIGYLPGKDYGTPQDQQIILRSHTDGPAISQDNGALGVLGIVAYFSHIPQGERPRTLMIYLDNRHYMPGMEKAFAKQDYFVKHPEALKPIVGLVATEHLGQMEYCETDQKYGPTGKPEIAFLWTRNDPRLIKMAVQAVQESDWPRVMVQCVEKPGLKGGPQGVWYGMGAIAREWNLPAFATMGAQGAYWTTTARLEAFDKDLFRKQVRTMSQLTGELMKLRVK